MRGKITDQDLTNYALNDGLEPRERLYVESMLAVSTECRNDIYHGLEMAHMLETGFERLYGEEATALTPEQRHRLLHPPQPRLGAMLHRTAATLALAACVALALVNPGFWQLETHRRSLASVSSHVSQIVASGMSADAGIAPLVNLPQLSDEVDSLVQTAVDALPQSSTMCTPPSLNPSDFGDFR